MKILIRMSSLKYLTITCGLTLFTLLITGCKKLVEVNPPFTSLSSGNVYSDDATAAAALTGIYTNISLSNSNGFALGGLTSMSLFPALSADELTLFDPTNLQMSSYFRNMLTSSNTGGTDFWENIYPIIFVANSAIEGVGSSTSLTPSVKNQLLGEAKFVRALSYFYLVNLYGKVPVVTTTNYKVNGSLPRDSTMKVWLLIIQDLKDAKNLLSAGYLDATLLKTTIQRVRPTRWAAAALLARAYLYTNDWPDAVAQADSVIGNTGLYGLDSLNNVFLANSTEAIWQLQPVGTGTNSNTGDGALFILPSTGPSTGNYPVYLSKNVVSSFEPNDARRVNWVDSVIVGSTIYYYPYKYKIGLVNSATQEYIMVLRLGEQYLIRAEAEAELNDLSDAANDLNTIRNRANLPHIDPSIASSQAALLAAIQHERQVELFTEWGHRWLDLKRTETVNGVMGTGGVCAAKGGVWNTDWQWYPISTTELKSAPNLVQNIGY